MAVAIEIPELTWDMFLRQFVWRQGEHVSMVGPTGSGKTTLMLEILNRRALVCVFANKPRDDTMNKLARSGEFKVVSRFEYSEHQRKIILWPKGKDISDYEEVQAKAYYDALSKIWRIGYYAVVFDEVRYICQNLKLDKYVQLFWQQARALRVSVVAGTQRPAFVPVMMFDQATHLFFWCDNDELNLKRIGGLGATNSKMIREVVSHLEPRQVLYLNTRTGFMCTTKVELKKGPDQK